MKCVSIFFFHFFKFGGPVFQIFFSFLPFTIPNCTEFNGKTLQNQVNCSWNELEYTSKNTKRKKWN